MDWENEDRFNQEDESGLSREEIKEYVEQIESILANNPQMNEATTKQAVLSNFLELLDWKVPTNTQLEYSINMGSGTHKVDYALIDENHPIAFFEAKSVGSNLTSHRGQIAGYMKNENVNWGILSDGKKYLFFHRNIVESDVKIEKLARTNLEDLPQQSNILRVFTSEWIQEEKSEKKLTDLIEERKSTIYTLQNEKKRLSESIADEITEVVSDSIHSIAEKEAENMIGKVINQIENEYSFPTAPESIDKPEPINPNPGSYTIEIIDGSEPVKLVSGSGQAEAMANVVDYFIRNHNLIDKIEIPWVPNTRAVINNEPRWEKTRHEYKRVAEGYYVDTRMNARGKMKELSRLAPKMGLEVQPKEQFKRDIEEIS